MCIRDSDLVIMYGMVVGEVVEAIPQGGVLTTRNIRHRTGDYSAARQPVSFALPDPSVWSTRTFMGFHRADGQVGTRNYWPVSYTHLFEPPAVPLEGQVHALNTGLAEWAFNLTRATPLPDSEKLKNIRAQFDGIAAQRPPFVTIGDELSSSTYWHGKLYDAWAAQWVSYFTGGQGQFVTTAMEDTGTLLSLKGLAQAGRVDWQRILVLRVVGNFDQQPRGMSAADSLAAQRLSLIHI